MIVPEPSVPYVPTSHPESADVANPLVGGAKGRFKGIGRRRAVVVIKHPAPVVVRGRGHFQPQREAARGSEIVPAVDVLHVLGEPGEPIAQNCGRLVVDHDYTVGRPRLAKPADTLFMT